jgi:hypothetical protein
MGDPPDAVGLDAIAVLLVLSFLSAAGLWLLDRGKMRPVVFRRGQAGEAPLWSLVDVVACLGVFVLGSVATEIAFTAVFGGSAQDDPDAALRVAGQVMSGGMACGFVFLRVVLAGGQTLGALGFLRAPWTNLLAVPGLLALVYAPLCLTALVWRSVVEFVSGAPVENQLSVQWIREALVNGDFVSFALYAVGAVVVAPIVEELIFRGFLYGVVRARWGRGAALVGSSAVFAALHFSIYGLVPLFVVGLALAYVYERSGSLYSAIGFHAAFNLASLVEISLVG